jgi:RimJ/RimL family protein N-acetyltransferase
VTAILETDRLVLREIELRDAAFLHALLTDADFRANIGHRGVDTIDDAVRVIPERYHAAYRAHGFGMWVVEAEGVPIGMAGLVRREGLDHVDLGYAFLPDARGRGFAREAAAGVLAWAHERGIAPVVAIVSPGNAGSIRILESLGLVADGLIRLPGADHEVMLYQPGVAG